ncbi:glycosyltransferase family 2 protein [Fibrella forsythiae]|uniref:Glycosyltransferase family 2 protein n=1 Tax=Fibrella forsythiae TaxID=2817061 RepID=A0ABS3JJU8_9BACT|nr:glycosyltransferase family 2 protein [Fibrella forsythiae]MBO0949723.1 glycosyltransferase family 2 protein [Fibrella forsythiae]
MIYVVIPVHNRRELTRRCLECLAAQTYPHHQEIVVDDGSTDGTSEMIRQEFPNAIVLRGDGNLWWTEATNVGIRKAQELVGATIGKDDFLLTLNDDTEVKPDYLQTLLDTEWAHYPCVVGSPSVDIDEPEKLEFAGTKMNLVLAGGHHIADDYGRSYSKLVNHAAAIETDSLPGRGTLIPMEVFQKVGLYDSVRFAHYMADVEFSVRAQKAGYPLWVSTKSVVGEHVKATGIFLQQRPGWADFVKSFTSIRSPTNLTVRYHFAMVHSKTKLLYFVLDVARICGGFLRRKFQPA